MHINGCKSHAYFRCFDFFIGIPRRMETLVSLFFHELYFPLSVGICNRLNVSILRKAIRCFSKTPFLPSKNYLSASQNPPHRNAKRWVSGSHSRPTATQDKRCSNIPPNICYRKLNKVTAQYNFHWKFVETR